MSKFLILGISQAMEKGISFEEAKGKTWSMPSSQTSQQFCSGEKVQVCRHSELPQSEPRGRKETEYLTPQNLYICLGILVCFTMLLYVAFEIFMR